MDDYERDARPMPASDRPAAAATVHVVAVAVDSSLAAWLWLSRAVTMETVTNCAKVLAGKMQVLFFFLHARSAPSLPVYQSSASCLPIEH